MTFQLPKLPYEIDALAPTLSKETLEYHYGKHHKTYIDKLNDLTKGTKFADMSLEQIILSAQGAVFNNAAQAWNHTFYWYSLSPKQGAGPASGSGLLKAIERDFGSLDGFKKTFSDAALNLFGSGWAWLVRDKSGKLSVLATPNAENPLTKGSTPLLVCDVWEHAYYIDYRNARAKYIEAFWNIINWDSVQERYAMGATLPR
ncbi:MAG: superoxide dismutase [Bdellovibrionota bacterium]